MKYRKPRFICDKCGAEFPFRQFIKVRVGLWERYRFDLCDSCLEKLKAFLTPKEGEDKPTIGFTAAFDDEEE